LALYATRLHRAAIWLRRRSPTVLVYHACDPDDIPFLTARRLSISPSAFARQLEFLCAHYRIVDLATLESGEIVDRALAVTFDDGLRSIRTRMLPVLQRRAVPARVYLVTSVLNNAGLIWLHELAWVLGTHSAVARSRAAAVLGVPVDAPVEYFVARARDVATAAEVNGLLTELRSTIGYTPGEVARKAQLYLTDEDIAEMQRAGISFGNHTATHQDLSRLDAESCSREISDAADRLASVPGAVPSLAYPFGRRDEQARGLALSLGICSLAEVGGSNSAFDATRIARVSVAHQSVAELFAQMAVVEPAKEWLMRALRRRRPSRKSRDRLLHEAFD
jgi:peptidoglycan/xylan/chitin deacetylase (PgdA/CDA1 family)